MGKIKTESAEDLRTAAKAAAKAHKGKLVEREGTGTFAIETKTWAVEVAAADGWAFLHGEGELSGVSTNITDTGEIEAGIKRLQKGRG